MKCSLLKTLAGKHNCSVRKIMQKYFHDGRFQIKFLASGKPKTIYLYNYGFRKQPIIKGKSVKHQSKKLTNRMLSHQCEWCGSVDPDVQHSSVQKTVRAIRSYGMGAKHAPTQPQNSCSLSGMSR
jgi:hypothetical protein